MDSSHLIDVSSTVTSKKSQLPCQVIAINDNINLAGDSKSVELEQTSAVLSNENCVTTEPAAFTIYGATRSSRPGDGATTATSSISSTGDECSVVSTDASVPENYLTKFRKIVSPATGMIIAGHAQNVANSVVVVAKNAVSSVGATKSAIMNRQEARAKVSSQRSQSLAVDPDTSRLLY